MELQLIGRMVLSIRNSEKGAQYKKFGVRYWVTSLESSLAIHQSTGCSEFLQLMGRVAMMTISVLMI